MNSQKNPSFTTSIKEEYLPPPLEKNYLSLFDIQVKMTKEFLQGTEQQKIATIKKRIKKFFDYGNQDQSHSTSTKKTKDTSPCEIDSSKLKDGLTIDCSKIILYGSQMTTYETAEKMFPGFIGFQRIDDSNIKLSFSKKQECQNLLIQNSKDPNSILTQHIMNPSNIEWFELQSETGDQNKEIRKYYARFVTNKDTLLLGNQSYFRKLLGKARFLVDQRESQSLQRQKQAQVLNGLNKPKPFKRKFIKKNFMQKKYSKNFDQQTNYDGVFNGDHSGCFQFSREPIDYRSKNYISSFNSRYRPRSRPQLQRLDLSDIRPIPIDLENYSNDRRGKSKKQKRSQSKDSIKNSLNSHFNNFNRQDGLEKMNLRDQIIKKYRQKQFSDSQTNLKLFRSTETDKFNRNKGPF